MGLMGANPVVIVGMHRSGTSLTAAFLEALGVDLGGNLLAADCHNAKGYFEDVDFLEFQRQLLQARSRSDDGGWPDWGWTEGEGLDLTDLESEYGAAARGLIEARPGDLLWGWKDPRTALLLEFWDRLLPNAVYLMVYRLPWDVADSVLRIGHPTFVERPEYGLRAWHFYNRRLLDFYERRRDRCVLFNVNGLLAQPERLADLVEAKLGLRVAGDRRTLGSVFDPALFGQLGWHDPLPQALRQVAPAYWGLLDELDRVADLPSDREGIPVGAGGGAVAVLWGAGSTGGAIGSGAALSDIGDESAVGGAGAIARNRSGAVAAVGGAAGECPGGGAATVGGISAQQGGAAVAHLAAGETSLGCAVCSGKM
jgi:hypothetical protein